MCLSLEPTVGSIVCCVPLCSDKLMDKLRLSSEGSANWARRLPIYLNEPQTYPPTPLLNT